MNRRPNRVRGSCLPRWPPDPSLRCWTDVLPCAAGPPRSRRRRLGEPGDLGRPAVHPDPVPALAGRPHMGTGDRDRPGLDDSRRDTGPRGELGTGKARGRESAGEYLHVLAQRTNHAWDESEDGSPHTHFRFSVSSSIDNACTSDNHQCLTLDSNSESVDR